MTMENIINNENIELSNGGLAFHYGTTQGRVNRSWKPSTKGTSGCVTVRKNGITIMLPSFALTKKGTLKKAWAQSLAKMGNSITIEQAIELADKGAKVVAAA